MYHSRYYSYCMTLLCHSEVCGVQYAFCDLVTQLFPADYTLGSATYNHYGQYEEPNFDYVAWGSNVPRLQQIKDKYDPTHTLNAKHTFGYKPFCSSNQ